MSNKPRRGRHRQASGGRQFQIMPMIGHGKWPALDTAIQAAVDLAADGIGDIVPGISAASLDRDVERLCSQYLIEWGDHPGAFLHASNRLVAQRDKVAARTNGFPAEGPVTDEMWEALVLQVAILIVQRAHDRTPGAYAAAITAWEEVCLADPRADENDRKLMRALAREMLADHMREQPPP